MPYIEKDREGEFFNPVSSTVQINPNCDCGCNDSTSTTEDSDDSINLNRWKWLIDGWDKMTFSEKIALFTPYVRAIRLYSYKYTDFDKAINDEIVNTVFEECRTFSTLKYDEDHHGSPCFALIFNPINVDVIPDADTRYKVRHFGEKYGFLTSKMTCSCGG